MFIFYGVSCTYVIMDSIDWMFICIGVAALGIVGARYFEYKSLQEQNTIRHN